VSKNDGAIEGQYFIDVSIPPAPQLVSDTVSGAENLSLYTKNGTVTADVWVTGNSKSKRVSMKLCSDKGHVYAKIVCLLLYVIIYNFSSKLKKKNAQHDVFSENDARPSLNLDLRATYGDISISLPRCFRGPIKIHTSHDRIAFSTAFEERMALLSDVQSIRVYFVGDRPRSGRWCGGDNAEGASAGGSQEEPLDELSVNGWHSSVRIRWDGEPELPYTNQGGWVNFCMGTARFFTTSRVKL
jgi:hypothetical protein